VLDPYLETLAELAGEARVGDPADPTVTIGPLISAAQRHKVETMVDRARGDGAQIVVGGRRPDIPVGFYYEPTFLTGLEQGAEIVRKEVFGPVGVVLPFDDDDQAVAMANDSDYGLAAAIYSADSGPAYRMAERLRTGRVRINGGNGVMSVHSPMGGWKRSGFGVEHGLDGALELTLAQIISFNAG
jgi:acyl-CoA reductase-like NAD-dependent aldehyde dehydrogenase